MANVVSMENVIPNYQTVLAVGSVFLGTVQDKSEYAIKGASVINYPTLAPMVAENKAITASFTNESDLGFGDDKIDLNKKLGRGFKLNLHQQKQNVLRAFEAKSQDCLRAIGALADEIVYDAAIVALEDIYVVPTSDFYADVVDLGKKLDDAKVPRDGNRYLWIGPVHYAKLLKTKDFVRFDGTGSGEAMKTGMVGQILGFKVVMSPLIDGVTTGKTDAIALHTNAVAYGWQGEMLLMEETDALATSVQYSMSDLFGCNVTQDGAFACRLGAAPTP